MPWLPDETLFSLCSRNHRLWGHTLSARSTELLFGRSRAGTHHDIPSSLDEFVIRTSGVYGDARQLATEHTLLKFYRPFMSESQVAHAVGVMRSGSVAHLKFKLGLLTSRFRANHPLKACPQCMSFDLHEQGWSYWHVTHQFPGVWTCPQHGEPLLTSTVKSTGVERFDWHLPDQDHLVVPEACLSRDLNPLHKLTQLVVNVLSRNQADGCLDSTTLQKTLLDRFAERGWLTASGQLRLKLAAISYLDYLNGFKGLSEFDGLPFDAASSNAHLGRLLRPMRTGTHPLRWLSIIDWLYSDADEFEEQRKTQEGGRGLNEIPLDLEQSDVSAQSDGSRDVSRREQLMTLVRSGYSATRAAKEVGVDTTIAMAWMVANGHVTKRRPKQLKTELRNAAIKDLKGGADKAETAQRHGITVQSVTRLLRSEAGLHAQWTEARFSNAQVRARTAWLDVLEACDGLGVKWMRSLESAAYAWLYRNDRAWLIEHSPRSANEVTRTVTVDWDRRDRDLSRKVAQAACQIQSAQSKPLKLWQLYQAVPELKPKLSVLRQLPLTLKVLEEVLPRRSRKGSEPLF